MEKALWNEFYGRLVSNFFFLIFIKIKKCFIWLHWVLVAACEILSCGMLTLGCSTWALFPLTGSNLGPLPALGVWSLSHWTTRQVPLISSHESPNAQTLPILPPAVPWQVGLRNINQTQSIRYASLKVRHRRTEAWDSLEFMLVKLVHCDRQRQLVLWLWFLFLNVPDFRPFSGPGSYPSGSVLWAIWFPFTSFVCKS